jgi:formylglycine-generating enzyme required for sulfatase activity
MLRSSLTLVVMCVPLLAQQQSKPVKPAEDMSKISPVAHALLFQSPNAAGLLRFAPGKRLPSEAEWERACHGVAEGSKYPWDDREPTTKDAQFGAQNPDAVCGEKNRNYFGLCGMIGNIWEWTAD